ELPDGGNFARPCQARCIGDAAGRLLPTIDRLSVVVPQNRTRDCRSDTFIDNGKAIDDGVRTGPHVAAVRVDALPTTVQAGEQIFIGRLLRFLVQSGDWWVVAVAGPSER